MNKKIKNKEFHMRISSEEFLIVQYLAARANMSVAEYMRALVFNVSLPIRKKLREGELTYDYLETYCNNKL